MYVHWPAGKYDPVETLSAFVKLIDESKIRHIGVSNFGISHMEKALEVCEKPIVVNQIEIHPKRKEKELVDFLQKRGIYTIAYSPLGRGQIFEIPEMNQLAKKYGVSEAQIALQWLMSKEKVIPIPKATTKDHIQDNFNSLDLTLSEKDLTLIDSLPDEEKIVNPAHSHWRKD
jgi:2,5-diketo-D-gluconate reductase B